MRNNRWVGPVLLIGLLIVTSLLTVLWPAISTVLVPDFGGGEAAAPAAVAAPSADLSPQEVEIEYPGYIIDVDTEPIFIGQFALLGIITAVVIVGLIGATGAIAGLFWLISRFVANNNANPEFQSNVSAIQTRIKNEDKERTSAAPARGVPDHSRPIWWAWATGMMSVFLAYYAGLVIGAGISDGASQTLSTLAAVTAAVISYVNFRPKTITAFNREDKDAPGPNWSLIWVLLSGGLMMGLGIGLMYIVISGNNPIPFVIWDADPNTPLIDWTWFWDLSEPLRTWN